VESVVLIDTVLWGSVISVMAMYLHLNTIQSDNISGIVTNSSIRSFGTYKELIVLSEL